MRVLFFSLTVFVGFTSCIQQLSLSEDPGRIPLKRISLELGSFADSDFTDSTDINELFIPLIVDSKGIVKKVGMEEALNTYNVNIVAKKPNNHPIFEVKGTDHVLLMASGQGLWDKIWAKLIVDKKTLEIVKIAFDHKSEAAGYGANINEYAFTRQFIGTKIDFTKKNYSLQGKKGVIVKGKQKIDGLTGATMTSIGAVKMLNSDLQIYKSYFRN